MQPQKDALLTVGQFANLVGATRSQLLFYDRAGIFHPAERQNAGDQAPNRRYRLSQAYPYQTINALKETGCRLEDAARCANGDAAARRAFLEAQLARIGEEKARLSRVQGALELSLYFENIMARARPDTPFLVPLHAPLRALYRRWENPCLRQTERFALLYTDYLQATREDLCVLPFPIALTFNAKTAEDERYPVTGILSACRGDAGADAGNYTLDAGEYMAFFTSNPIGSFAWVRERCVEYQRANGLFRVSPIYSWNLNAREEAGKRLFTEFVAYRVIRRAVPRDENPYSDSL